MFLVVGVAVFYYFVYIAFSRLLVSPISHIPGPRLAAFTFWYEFYYDVVLKGRYTWKIQELHKKYGPIIRINPEEVHINDPEFYDQVYVGSSRRTNKWPWSARMFGTSMAAVGTVDHDVHRLRRAALNPFFSKKSIADLEPVIQAQVDKLCSRLGECKGQVVNLSDALACLSGDVISDCAFGETYGLLDGPDFAPEWRSFMMDLSLGTHLMKQFGSVYQLIMTIVPWLLPLLHPLSRKLERLRINLTRQIEAIRASPGEAKSHRTFFHSLLAGDLPPHEKSTARLTDEALTIIGAGTVTTSHTIALTLFHVLANPSIKTKLRGELRIASANGSSMTWSHLAQLPYLTAVVTEGLRLASGVSHRLQRIDPDHALYYKQYTILAGTPVSQTQMFIMTDSTLFPQPMDFVPDRWLADCLPEGFPLPNEAKKHFVPFSRGTRSCVGMNMAYAEIYLTIAAMLSTSLDLTLFETTGRNFEVAHDWFNPCPPLDSKGLRVMIG